MQTKSWWNNSLPDAQIHKSPQKLVDVIDKIGYIDVPLEELEEHIKERRDEKETLLHEIDEARSGYRQRKC